MGFIFEEEISGAVGLPGLGRLWDLVEFSWFFIMQLAVMNLMKFITLPTLCLTFDFD